MSALNQESHLPLYLQLMASIKNLIKENNLQADSRIPSRPWLMKTFGVSDGTIKKAIDKLVEEGTLYRIKGKGIFVSSFAQAAPKTIGLLPFDIDFLPAMHANHYVAALEHGIQRYAASHGCELSLISNNSSSSEGNSSFLKSNKNIDGFILLARDYQNPCIDEIIQSDRPIVSIMKKHYKGRMEAIDFDEEQGALLATEHLIKLGHQKIALLEGDMEKESHIARFRGYKKALAKHQLPFDPELIIESSFSVKDGYISTLDLLERNHDFSALFAMGDGLAIGAMKALKETGRKIPEDVSVVGYMNLEIAEICEPGLTTINMPVQQMGYAAAEYIANKLDQKQAILPQFEPEIIIRQSTTNNIKND